MSKQQTKRTDLSGLIALDSRSIMQMHGSSVISIPSANDLGITENANALEATVSVRRTNDEEIIVQARLDISHLEDFNIDIQD